ncbi:MULTISPECIES: GGDEF domain-containing protein [Vibrio]|uniref:diguanylate cyclase n=1 Tax=Vibrio chanodichtyis TaxID=3027932 RepID=A0ABT5UXB6_9VIBR|nr:MULTISPECIES: GGDEF domain-containing protein [Vibrio]MDE1514060.1 diguanylate cyclase [Vibrio chanodichtyis]
MITTVLLAAHLFYPGQTHSADIELAKLDSVLHNLEDADLHLADYSAQIALLGTQQATYPLSLKMRLHHLECEAIPERTKHAYAAAIAIADQQLEIAQRLGDKQAQSGYLACRGRMHYGLGNKQAAIDDNQQALDLALEVHDLYLQAKINSQLGLINASQGLMLKALKQFNLAQEQFNHQGYDQSAWRQQAYIANTYRRLGNYEYAAELFNQLLTHYKQVNDINSVNDTRIYLAIVYTKMKQYSLAIAELELADQYFSAIPRWYDVVEIRLLWAEALLMQRQTQLAIDKLTNVRSIDNSYFDKMSFGILDLLTGLAYSQQGQHKDALAFVTKAIPVLEQDGHQELMTIAYKLSAELLNNLGQYQASVLMYQTFIETNSQLELDLRNHASQLAELEQTLSQLREHNIELQHQQQLKQQINDSQLKIQRWRNTTFALFILLLFAILGFQLRSNYRWKKLSETDELTGLYNRRKIMALARHHYTLSQKSATSLAVLLIDIDFFKKINDLHGHKRGDEILVEVAHTIRDCMDTGDMVGRSGGEEFLVILTNQIHHDAVSTAEKIRTMVANLPSNVSVSIGIAQLEQDSDVEQIIHRADIAMYQAKQQGRNQVAIARPNS